jgi:hypothetical protein
MFLQEQWDLLGVVLRFANVMVRFWRVCSLLIPGLPNLVAPLMNAPDACLTPLNLCYLLYEMLAAGASISSFC